MAETSITTTPSPTPAPPPAKKNLWETTITSTPVIMTVIATLFAGMSASEMTWAQYHRATAAQNQSKVGDQYNYFQAKRIRGTSMDMTSTLLRALAEPGQFDAATMEQTANMLADELGRAEQEIERLARDARTINATADTGEAKDNPAMARLQKAADASLGKVKAIKQEAVKLRKETEETLSKNKDKMNAAFGYLKAGLPETKDEKLSDKPALAPYAEDIEALVLLVSKEVPEEDTAKLIRKVPEQTLKSAYQLAKQNSKKFEEKTDELKDPLVAINKLVQQQLDQARKLHRVVTEINRALPDATVDDTKTVKDIRATAGSLALTDRSLKDNVEQLFRDHKAASIDYDARRYNAEARYNLRNAQLYELQVRKSNFESDRHMHRKTFLFYAMLTAQAGVTIATLALAFRKKSVVWGLAAMAGAAAVGFGGFVAMTM